jgi:aryl-alcohol dehydrogenase-like predicted oxidoreductase
MISQAFVHLDWRVHRLGLGCWQYGGAITIDGHADGWPGIDDNESIATIQHAVSHGINCFDTADMYGWGHSEEIVGRALAGVMTSVGGRENLFVATKVGFWHDGAFRRTYNETRDYIVRACDDSLRRLQTDYIDLYQCHLWRTERWTEFLDAFEHLRSQGKIRAYGVSTNDLDMVQRFNERNALAAVQANFNMLDPAATSKLIPYCQQHNITFIARGPLAMGKLSGKINRTSTFAADDIRSKWLDAGNRAGFDRDIDRVERIRRLADSWQCPLAALAIRYVLSHDGVSVAIPGARNRHQLDQNLAAAKLPALSVDQLDRIHRELRC